jgi:hypothetical protein
MTELCREKMGPKWEFIKKKTITSPQLIVRGRATSFIIL